MSGAVRSFRTGVVLPGATLRVLLLAVVWVGVVVLNPFPLWQGVAVVAALVSVILPRALTAWVAAACLPFGVILTEPSPGRTALALLLVHAIHVLAALGLVVPLSSRLPPAVLIPSAMRFLVVQLIAQPIVFGAFLLAPGSAERGIAWLAPAAAVALLAGVLLAVRAARNGDAEPEIVKGGADVRGPS